MNCKTHGITNTTRNSLLSTVGAFGQHLSIQPTYSVFVVFLYIIATLAWTTTPLQFAVAMMHNIIELRSARNFIRAELLDSRQDSDSAESVLKRLHAHVVAADIGSCRCNEVFGIVIAGNLFLDLSLISVLLSALQDEAYVQSLLVVLKICDTLGQVPKAGSFVARHSVLDDGFVRSHMRIPSADGRIQRQRACYSIAAIPLQRAPQRSHHSCRQL